MAARSSEDLVSKSGLRLSCGIDIGTENMAVSFVSRDGTVISYHGSHASMNRYQIGDEITSISPRSPVDVYDAFMQMFGQMKEFSTTDEVMIELQLAYAKSSASRMDGILYGFIQGRFPGVRVTLNAPTIRAKFIKERFISSELDIDSVVLPVTRKPKPAKVASMKYAYVFYPEVWDFIEDEADKMDDISDTLVYADLAYSKAHPLPKRTRTKKVL